MHCMWESVGNNVELHNFPFYVIFKFWHSSWIRRAHLRFQIALDPEIYGSDRVGHELQCDGRWLSQKYCCRTSWTHWPKCEGSPSCIHTISLRTFRYCNSGIMQFCNIDLYRSLVTNHDLTPMVVTFSKKYQELMCRRYHTPLSLWLRAKALVSHMTSVFLNSMNEVLSVNFPHKEKFAASLHNNRSGHLSSSSNLTVEKFAKAFAHLHVAAL